MKQTDKDILAALAGGITDFNAREAIKRVLARMEKLEAVAEAARPALDVAREANAENQQLRARVAELEKANSVRKGRNGTLRCLLEMISEELRTVADAPWTHKRKMRLAAHINTTLDALND